jgi:hypothetical protein
MMLGLGVALAGGVFLVVEGLWDFAESRELLASLELGGSGSWGVALEASELRGFSVLVVSSPVWGSLIEESDSISCGALYNL